LHRYWPQKIPLTPETGSISDQFQPSDSSSNAFYHAGRRTDPQQRGQIRRIADLHRPEKAAAAAAELLTRLARHSLIEFLPDDKASDPWPERFLEALETVRLSGRTNMLDPLHDFLILLWHPLFPARFVSKPEKKFA
jgi:hypothetical protein